MSGFFTRSGIGRHLMRHTVVRNAAVLYAVQFSSYIFPLITLPYLSRVLTQDHFGVIAYAQTFIWYFVTLTEYGFNLSATRAVAVARDNPREIDRIFSAVMVAKLLLTLLGLVICYLSVLSIPALRPHLLLFMVTFGSVFGYFLFPLWLYQGLQKMGTVAVRDFVAKLMSLAALFLLVRSDRDYLLAAAAQSGGLLVAGVIGLAAAPRQLGVRFRWPQSADIAEQLRAGWPAFVSLAVSAVAIVTNTFILGLRAPLSEVGFFSASQRIIAAMRSLVAPISTAVYPHAAQKGMNSEAEVIRFVHKYQLFFSAPFIAAGVALFATAPFIVPAYLGRKYAPAVPAFQLMAFVPALLSLTQVYSTYYMLACGYYKQWMRIVLITIGVNFLVLAPSILLLRGSVALALTALLSEASGTFLYWRFYRQHARPAIVEAAA